MRFDANYWRDKAEKTRTKARLGWLKQKEKNMLLRAADEYDKVADRVAEAAWLGIEGSGRK